MSKTLIIVEAPNKLAKIQKILGNEYVIKASVGHIMDLDPKDMSIDLNTFTPNYIICKDKHDVVKDLKSQYKKCDNILLATDDDTEGSFIAWSLAQQLNIKNPKRIIFHALTEKDLNDAIKSPIDIDLNRVDSQKTRRMLDRIIGYHISPLLWKCMSGGGLSAGRVQSVVVRIIIEKEEEIKNFFENEEQTYFKVNANFDKKYRAILCTKNGKKKSKDDEEIDDNNDNDKISNEKFAVAKIKNNVETKKIMSEIHKSEFVVSEISERESTRQPSAPFTTDSLIQDAHRKLGFTTQRTTSAAQNLYASGYVTYIRTDSTTMSESALSSIKKFVIDEYGKEYHRQFQYITKSKSAQEAHEAIRPTNIKTTEIPQKDKCGKDEIMLYRLIWKRSVASQMMPAIFNIANVEIDISKIKDYKFLFEHEVCIFDGFLKVYNNKEEEENEQEKNGKLKLPKKNQNLEISDVFGIQDYKKPPCRYDDGSLIGKIKKLGIGRPSTYNSIIKKIQDAGYVIIQNNPGIEKQSLILNLEKNGNIKEESKKITLGKDQKKCVPTNMGFVVNKFLMEHFPDIMDYQFTSNMEDKLDDIANGDLKMLNVLNEFYSTFKPLVDKVNTKVANGGSLKQMKEIGTHPTLKYKIYTMIAKYGPIVQMLDENGKIINTAPIKEPLHIDTITINEAVKLFEYPKLLGKHGRKNITLYKGQYGFYIKYGTEKISMGNTENNFTLDDAIKKIEEKNSKILWEGKDKNVKFVVLEGQYGKFINASTSTKKGKNYKLPQEIEPKDLTIDKVYEIIEKSRDRKKPKMKKPKK